MSTSTAKKVVVVDGSRTPFALASTYVVLGSLDDVVVLGKLSSLVHTNTSYDQPHTHTHTQILQGLYGIRFRSSRN